MLYSSIDFENHMNYLTSQYRREAARHSLARQFRQNNQSHSRISISIYDRFLVSIGRLMVTAGGKLQQREGGCQPVEQAA